ncbi:subtilisin-like protease SBT1.5 [Mercurialis annua]|uniref:subtilisin-like protease SBT1.5 n=1 Tax=Mercurialis annua TaxID=3986 RepID=UPI00215E79F0|nr:subtilisin-like protease SBT1.5 [Mercurialis annua]
MEAKPRVLDFTELINSRIGNASLNNSGNAAYCRPDSLDKQLVRGKIVVCDYGADFGPALGLTVKKSGGVGVIVAYVKPDFLMAEAYLTPGLSISSSNRQLLFDYMFSTANPRATIQFRGTQLGIKPAPVVADFSSRGPNKQSRYVMKPDVIAPGVDILAGWSQLNPPTRTPEDKRRTEFNIISGTSMACPHVSGIAALLKGMNPDWSPAMIKSAIMTTAYTHDRDGNPILEEPFYSTSTPWDMGSGHLDPQKAQDPGLVYDITSDDYVEFLCASNLTKKDIKIITRRSSAECESTLNPWDINYPAISVAFEASKPYIKMIVVKRTMTNVGDEMSNYTVAVNGPKGVSVTVDPPELVFKSKGEKLSYMVRIVPYKVPSLKYKSEFGHFVWSDGTHYVTSPLVVTWHA